MFWRDCNIYRTEPNMSSVVELLLETWMFVWGCSAAFLSDGSNRWSSNGEMWWVFVFPWFSINVLKVCLIGKKENILHICSMFADHPATGPFTKSFNDLSIFQPGLNASFEQPRIGMQALAGTILGIHCAKTSKDVHVAKVLHRNVTQDCAWCFTVLLVGCFTVWTSSCC